MTRPKKFTPEAQEKILKAIHKGASYKLAAQYGGICYDTFNNWMKAGKAEEEGELAAFVDAVREAEGKAAYTWLTKIETAASKGNWQAAAWKLERRYPNEYGRTVNQVEHSGPEGGEIPIMVVKGSLLEALKK